MNSIGVIEGFFGPQWPLPSRLSYAEFLAETGGDFFIYAPKQDPFLRKKWRDQWTMEYLDHLKTMIERFHKNGIKFGVGFSPFGLGTTLSDADKSLLSEKLKTLQSLKIDMLGLFFDDMPVTENLAKTQIETLEHLKKEFKGQIVFCPSYYTPDPILDKVFGERPAGYLEEIANGVAGDVSIAWTGPKVISPEIPEEHLRETTEQLKRRPFIWENLFANDGPKNCKFLKLRPFAGRTKESFAYTEAFGFNMMNQPELSKLMYLSSSLVLKDGMNPMEAFRTSFERSCSKEFAEFMEKNHEMFLTKGLDNFSQDEKDLLSQELRTFKDKAASEILAWLHGEYNVGSECLTD